MDNPPRSYTNPSPNHDPSTRQEVSLISDASTFTYWYSSGDKVAWECANGGQIWTADAAASSSVETTATIPGGFCTTGFHSLQTYFIVGLMVDIVCQLYMAFLICKSASTGQLA